MEEVFSHVPGNIESVPVFCKNRKPEPTQVRSSHEKQYYEAAQAAHEEFFVATNKLIDEAFQVFEKAYAKKRNCTSRKALL